MLIILSFCIDILNIVMYNTSQSIVLCFTQSTRIVKEYFMNTAKKAWIIIGSVVLGLAIICLSFGVYLKIAYNGLLGFTTITTNKEVAVSILEDGETANIHDQFDLSGTRKIKLKSTFGVVSFNEGDEFNVTATNVLSEKYRFTFNGSDLSIVYSGDSKHFNSIHFGVDSHTPVFQITVPKGVALEELDIEVGAVDLTINNISAREVDIECGAGEVDINDVSFNDFELSSGASDLSYHGKLTGESKIHGGIGVVDMEIQGNASDYEILGSVGLGSLSINGNNYDGFAKDLVLNAGAPMSIEIDSGVGDIILDFVE